MTNDDLLALLDDHGFKLADFGAADREFLRGVSEHGEATTSDLREYALGRKQIHYRYDSLEEDGLIDVDRVGLDEHDGRKQNVATLTELGERIVEAGLLDEVTDSNTNLEGLERRFQKLREDAGESLQIADRNRKKIWDRIDSMEDRLDAMENRLAQIENAQQTVPSADD